MAGKERFQPTGVLRLNSPVEQNKTDSRNHLGQTCSLESPTSSQSANIPVAEQISAVTANVFPLVERDLGIMSETVRLSGASVWTVTLQ